MTMQVGSTPPLGAGGMSRVFAVLAQPHAPESSGGVFGSYTTHLRDLVERAQAEGWAAYVFSYRDLLKQRRLIWGWTRSNGSWERAFCVLPHVAVVRRPTLSEAELDAMTWLRDEGGVQFFNHPEIEAMTNDRWRSLHVLGSSPTLTRVIPEVTLLRDSATIASLSAATPQLMAFSRYRGQANELVLLNRQADAMACRREFGERVEEQTFRSLLRVRSYLESTCGETMLVPYREPLLIEGHPLMVRVFMQRGERAAWQPPIMLLRFGQQGMIGGRYATAGLAHELEGVLEEHLQSKTKSFLYHIHTTAEAIVHLLDVRVHGLGELTIDFRPTADGELSVHDLAVSPAVLSLQRLRVPTARAAALQSTLAYALHLHAEFVAPTRLSAASARTR